MADDELLGRVEDAGINASAPPQQLWLDGWLVRFSPGKAKRARCIQPVAPGRGSIDEKLERATAVYRQAGLPAMVRVTPFAEPEGLDAHLAGKGWRAEDDTRVMVCTDLVAARSVARRELPAGMRFEAVGPASFAHTVGTLRGSSLSKRQAHAERLENSPVPFHASVLRPGSDGLVACCGQFALEGDLVGLYDIFTAPADRGRGLAMLLCARLLDMAASRGATVGYLQVDADNVAARKVYERLGFADAYGYHYRVAPGEASSHDV